MKEKMIMILNERGIEVEEERFELVDGTNETGEYYEKDILFYNLNEDGTENYQMYPTTGNVYYQDIEKDIIEEVK